MPQKKLNESPFIKYNISSVPGFEKYNEKNLPIIIEALKAIHINLNVTEDNELSLFIPASYYNEYHKRNAGRKKKIMSKSGEYITFEYEGKQKHFYSGDKLLYSDMIILLLTRTDSSIIKELNIPRATFYRHKNTLLNSNYYAAIDKDKLNRDFALSQDAETYFSSIPGNVSF